MQQEIEAKFLNVNHDEIRMQLKKLGAVCKQPQRLMRRRNFDFPDRKLQKDGGWVRLRDELSGVTLTYKQVKEWDINGVFEAMVGVDDYEKASDFLKAVGLKAYSNQESKREVWQLKDVEIMLDEWPWVKPILEIEAPSQQQVQSLATDLGLNWSDAVFGSVEPVYMAEYDITMPEFYDIDTITFNNPVPDWLEKKRKK